jgi:predicted nuclease with RNAse H fold
MVADRPVQIQRLQAKPYGDLQLPLIAVESPIIVQHRGPIRRCRRIMAQAGKRLLIVTGGLGKVRLVRIRQCQQVEQLHLLPRAQAA